MLFACTAAVAGGQTEEAAVEADFMENFRFLCSVPRPSGHEKAVSDRLKAWAEGQGLAVRRNAANDLLFDVPATEGLEHLPLVALQAHLDMVCVGREGTKYDPLADPIVPLEDESGVLIASGTSLGADDGAGVAIIMSIVKGKMPHGPLRVVWTTDEEVGMTGALAITKEDLAGVKYLVNIDSEESGTVTVSSAADARIVATAAPRLAAPAGDAAFAVSVSGLRGGHSGMEIGEGRCNAIRALAGALFWMEKTAPYGLASFEGGTADNAIPAAARAVIVVEKAAREKLEAYLAEMERELRERHAGKDDGVAFTLEETALPAMVIEKEQQHRILEYVVGSKDGVNTMSADVEELVESSSNLGLIAVGPDGITIRQMPRSSVVARLEDIAAHQRALGAACGLEVAIKQGSRAWPVKPDSVLVAKIREAYRQVNNGAEMKVAAIHAGLECGVFSELAEGLDMASIGPDIQGCHSPDEKLLLPSVAKTWRLLEKLLVSLE
jgi:dipeptidase D